MFLLTRKTLRGVWPALVTPWTDNDQLDQPRFRDEIRAYDGTGVAGVYTGGTTGEFYAQDDETFRQVAQIACEEAHALGLPVQIGCTALSTRTVCHRIRTAVEAGADGIQLALPFWLELQDDEVRAFFEAATVAAGTTPLILYQSLRAKRRVEPPLLTELAHTHPTLIGMKDTAATIEQLQHILQAVPDLAIFGSEHDLLAKRQVGGSGTYSSVALLNPWLVVKLDRLCAAGDDTEARPLQEIIARYVQEVLLPMVREEGLLDSAVDRVQRIAGGVDVGLRCQGPYRSASVEHVERLKNWCRQYAPTLLAPSAADF